MLDLTTHIQSLGPRHRRNGGPLVLTVVEAYQKLRQEAAGSQDGIQRG